MSNPSGIDVTFDLRSDTPLGKDPDTHSPTLRRYHQVLWSKALPNGARFDLSSDSRGAYLRHTSQLGDFILTSDACIRTFRRVRRASAVINQVPEEAREAFSRQGYTIGGMMIFPGRRIGGKQTINQRRGTHPKISDRLDLTLECIRRHYLGERSPLDDTLARYDDFFALFDDFRGYADYFLLQDLVAENYRAVRFFAPFDNFTSAAIPRTLDEYEAYRTLTLQFIEARNARIAASLESSGPEPGRRRVELAGNDLNPLDATLTDHLLTVSRALISVALGPGSGLINELLPSAIARQQERAIRSLQETVQRIVASDAFKSWPSFEAGEEFDAAVLRAVRAAEESAGEAKRELIWYALINGWVRTNENPLRDRFQRITAKYDLEHFQVLKLMQSMVTDDHLHWFKFESGQNSLVDSLGRGRDAALAYVQEFAADGLVMIYDQPEIREASNGSWVQTSKIVLWKHTADRLLEFVDDPRIMLRTSVPKVE